jgi:hypothetical protein
LRFSRKGACFSYPQVEIGKAAITFLLGLLTPVGAPIKAVITIVSTVMFLIGNASRLPWRRSSVVSLLSDDPDFDGPTRFEMAPTGRVEPSANSAVSVANPRDA